MEVKVYTQKEVAENLDYCARRAGMSAATSKQCWFLAGLMIKHNEGHQAAWMMADTSVSGILSKSAASKAIDFYLSF